MKPYCLGLYEKALPEDWRWQQKLQEAAQTGFDFMELSIDETPERQSRLQWTEVQKKKFSKISREELPVTSICLSAHRKYPIGSHFAEVRKKGMDIMEQAIELAYDLGIRIIQLAGYDVYYEEVSDAESKKYFTENLLLASRMAASRGVLLGLETMENDFMNTVEKAMAYVNEIASPYLGVYPDVGNVSNGTENVTADLRSGIGHIFSAHLKETKPGIYRNLRFGEGTVDFHQAADTLLASNVLRFTAECWYLPGRNAKEEIQRAYDYLSEILNDCVRKGE